MLKTVVLPLTRCKTYQKKQLLVELILTLMVTKKVQAKVGIARAIPFSLVVDEGGGTTRQRL